MSLQSEDLSCPVCQDIFRAPVVLSCSHSFCKDCLQTWWSEREVPECPVCKRRSSRSEPPCNLALKNVCEAFLQDRDQRASEENLCSLHAEKLKLYCLDHQQPICLVCRDSRSHAGHRFRPVQELASENKKDLRKLVEPLEDQLKVLRDVQGHYKEMAGHILVQAEDSEKKMRAEFQKLHEFLLEEEDSRVRALRQEEQQKSQLMDEKVAALGRDIEELSSTLVALEDELRADDVSFLRQYRAAADAARRHPLVDYPKLRPGCLIDVAKHLGNLAFNTWTRMKSLVTFTPVILDPNTANPAIQLSDDLTSLSHGERQKLPENPERKDYHRSVRGAEGFSSGAHSWDVEVGDNNAWFVGAAAVSVKENLKTGFWQVEFYNGKYVARSLGDTPIVLRVRRNLQRVRVHLDWNKGKLSFYDLDLKTHVHSFTHVFSQSVFPCFGTLSEPPLKVIAAKVSVTRDS
ncbi:E3 ubiquitin-protein ligase TRIM35-like [Neosynchiropus ocellatus]